MSVFNIHPPIIDNKHLIQFGAFEIKNEDYQWALQLTDYLLLTNPNNKEATILRMSSLIALGERESNPNFANRG